MALYEHMLIARPGNISAASGWTRPLVGHPSRPSSEPEGPEKSEKQEYWGLPRLS